MGHTNLSDRGYCCFFKSTCNKGTPIKGLFRGPDPPWCPLSLSACVPRPNHRPGKRGRPVYKTPGDGRWTGDPPPGGRGKGWKGVEGGGRGRKGMGWAERLYSPEYPRGFNFYGPQCNFCDAFCLCKRQLTWV